MNKCKKIQKLMTSALYNELTDDELSLFQAHISACETCGREFSKLREVTKMMNTRKHPEMSNDFWENYYHRLEERLDDELAGEQSPEPAHTFQTPVWKHWFDWLSFPKHWVLIPAGAAALLVVGIAIGYYFSLPVGKKLLDDTFQSMRSLSPAVNAHFDNMQPLLVDYANYSPGEAEQIPVETVVMEKKTIQRLLLENELLKRAAAKNNNVPLKQLLEDYEVILVEMSNCGEEERQVIAGEVQKFINDNDLLLKMKTLRRKPEVKNENI